MEQNYVTVTLCRLYLLQQVVYISFGPTNVSNASRMWEEYEDGGHSGRGHCSAQQRELFFNYGGARRAAARNNRSVRAISAD